MTNKCQTCDGGGCWRCLGSGYDLEQPDGHTCPNQCSCDECDPHPLSMVPPTGVSTARAHLLAAECKAWEERRDAWETYQADQYENEDPFYEQAVHDLEHYGGF